MANPIPSISEDELTASICRDSFYQFVKEFWSVVVPEKPVWNWHMELLCDELQTAAELVMQRWCEPCDHDLTRHETKCPQCGGDNINTGRPKKYDIIANVPPGSSKSTIISIMFPPWTWTRMPSARHIGGCYAQGLTQDLGRRSKEVVTSDKYKRCFPEIQLKDDQRAKSYFMNTQGGSVRRTTVGSVIIGEHAHFHEIDDPLDPTGAHSASEVQTVNTWCTETMAQRKVDSRITLLILVMQRLHQNDPTGYMLDKAKDKTRIRHLCLPATRNPHVRPRSARKHYGTDGLFDRVRLPREVLEEKKAMGTFLYAGQYNQHPVPLGGGMFKTGRLQYGPPPPMRELRVIRYWDKAATSGGGCFSAGVKVAERWVGPDGKSADPKRNALARRQYWVLHVNKGQWDTYEREQEIQSTAEGDRRLGKVTIGIENEGGSTGKDVALMSIQNLAGHKVIMHSPTGDKIARADPVSVQVNAGNVWIATWGDARDEWIAPFVEEMKYFPNGAFLDQIDGLSGGFSLLWRRKRAGGVSGGTAPGR